MNHIVPRSTQRFLKNYGGITPYAKPKWRLSVASDILIKEDGVHRIWAEGLSTAEKGGLNFTANPDAPGCNYSRYDNKPIRVVTGIMEKRRYPHLEGWILEVWYPSSSYGPRYEWNSYVAVDGKSPMLGPYPEEGDYEMQFGPWPKIPGTDVLQSLISGYTKNINSRTGTPETRAAEYLLRYQYEEQKAEDKRKAEYALQMADHLSPMHSSSLGASRWRNELAKNIGLSEHVGIL